MLPQRPPLDWRREYLPIRQRYSDGPNIKATIGNADGGNFIADGAFSNARRSDIGYTLGTQSTPGSDVQTFNASKVSSIYQDNLTEVRVNSLFAMYLIRSHEV